MRIQMKQQIKGPFSHRRRCALRCAVSDSKRTSKKLAVEIVGIRILSTLPLAT